MLLVLSRLLGNHNSGYDWETVLSLGVRYNLHLHWRTVSYCGSACVRRSGIHVCPVWIHGGTVYCGCGKYILVHNLTNIRTFFIFRMWNRQWRPWVRLDVGLRNLLYLNLFIKYLQNATDVLFIEKLRQFIYTSYAQFKFAMK